jgi:hypothetical protein
VAADLGLTSSAVVVSSASAAAAQVAALRERLPDAALMQSEVLAESVKRTRYKYGADQARKQRKSWKSGKDEQESIDRLTGSVMARSCSNISIFTTKGR